MVAVLKATGAGFRSSRHHKKAPAKAARRTAGRIRRRGRKGIRDTKKWEPEDGRVGAPTRMTTAKI
jgi:hypothetical protein